MGAGWRSPPRAHLITYMWTLLRYGLFVFIDYVRSNLADTVVNERGL